MLLSGLYCDSFNFDILCLTETKLSELSDSLFEIPCFEYLSVNRNSHGGGIRVYYRSFMKVALCPDFTGIFDSHEALFLRINLRGSVYLLGTFYRPPSSSAALFNEYLEHELLTDAHCSKMRKSWPKIFFVRFCKKIVRNILKYCYL